MASRGQQAFFSLHESYHQTGAMGGHGADTTAAIDPRWEDPDAYDADQSHDGDGRYPPDWPDRTAAVRGRQDGTCGRCRRSPPVVSLHVHHLRFLSEGGTNDLENLVALCPDCHSLMHPENDDLDGRWEAAPLFPAQDADPRVAIIRVPRRGERAEYGDDLVLLAATADPPDENYRAVSDATVPVSADVSTAAARDLDRLMRGRRYEPDDGEAMLHVRVLSPDYRTAVTDATVAEISVNETTADVDADGRATFTFPGDVRRVYVRCESDTHETEDGWASLGTARIHWMCFSSDGPHATYVPQPRRPQFEEPDPDSEPETDPGRDVDADSETGDGAGQAGPDDASTDGNGSTAPGSGSAGTDEPAVDTVEAAVYFGGIIVAAVLGNGYADLGLSGAVGAGMLAAVFLSPLIAEPEE